MSKQLTEKGKIFKGYAQQIIAKYQFGTNKMVNCQPDYFCNLDLLEAWKLVDELVEAGYLKKYYTTKTFVRGSRGFQRKDICGYDWIGLTEKGWAVANKYLNA